MLNPRYCHKVGLHETSVAVIHVTSAVFNRDGEDGIAVGGAGAALEGSEEAWQVKGREIGAGIRQLDADADAAALAKTMTAE